MTLTTRSGKGLANGDLNGIAGGPQRTDDRGKFSFGRQEEWGAEADHERGGLKAQEEDRDFRIQDRGNP